MTPTEAALRAALEKAQWALGTVCCHDTETQEARTEGLAACAKALAAPPHGKDAGEDGRCSICGHVGQALCAKHVDEYQGRVAEIRAQRDVLQARLTEAEGLLRRLVSAPWSMSLDDDVKAFLKKPSEDK